jgi:hypothetical protein
MLHWRAENSSLVLETEVDALSQDEDGYTPLVQIHCSVLACISCMGMQKELAKLIFQNAIKVH